MGQRIFLIALFGVAALGAPASAQTISTFSPVADARVVAADPNTSYGTRALLVTRTATASVETVMRFQVSGLSGSVSAARIRVLVANPTTNGPSVYRTSSTWHEGVTWNTRPARAGSAIADLGAMPVDAWAEVDVTSAITGNGTYDFLLAGGSSDGVSFAARESTTPPQLVVTTTGGTTAVATVDVTLQPRAGVSGTQRVNFAVPLARGVLWDPGDVRVLAGTTELAAARRELAVYPDGSVRSVQVQVDTPVSAGAVLRVRLGEAPTTTSLALVPVSSTLDPSDGTLGPRVWARLPASWLAASGVAGPQVTEAAVNGTALDAWDNVCDYGNHLVDSFLSQQSDKAAWLYDRGTTMYRGYVRRGDQATLESAYRETAIYRAGITGTGTSTRIGVPASADDVKYHYAQNLAIHFLLTGDDRFRDRAEDVALRIAALWSSPGYAGGSDFWTERHAGFALLAYVWARVVTDDQAAALDQLADGAVDAYLAVQAGYPPGYTDANARCFAHTGAAHGEGYSGYGCSPWMSAILAEGLDAYATEVGGTAATRARQAIVRLGTMLARDGRDGSGKPFYWLGVGSAADEVDPYDEHWGEPAYAIAMAWHHGGRSDPMLRAAADALVAGVRSEASSPHLRSFTWQCRAAVATPYYLR